MRQSYFLQCFNVFAAFRFSFLCTVFPLNLLGTYIFPQDIFPHQFLLGSREEQGALSQEIEGLFILTSYLLELIKITYIHHF